MNEAETRAELIDPKLAESGWGIIEGSRVLREHIISPGRIDIRSRDEESQKSKAQIADYVLVYKNVKLAVIEAKKESLELSEGVAQAKSYATKLQTAYAYSTNGHNIYQIDMRTGVESIIAAYPTPDEMWAAIYNESDKEKKNWREKFANVPFESMGGNREARYYQEIAVSKVMNNIADKKNRILLTLATGTGKTFVAFQIAWKLFETRWNISRDGGRKPRILFLADRNILADQAYNSFSAFDENALVRITPNDIRSRGSVPTNGSVFFAIFQTFMSGPNDTPYYGEYPLDFFDLIIIDECHRGGANDEGNWRGILEHFSSAVQIGLTATPKRQDNVDTYKYFGEPVYTYSLKEGVNDGFLTPFKVKRIKTTLDEYIYTSDDNIIEGEIEAGRIYTEQDFASGNIYIKEREEKRVRIFLDEINQNEKTIVFCANQSHAALVRDLVNKNKESSNPNYCQRVTANDGELGEQYLREFQDNEKSIPTILTTSQKLSTGVDARNVRNIILMRPVKSMIEFKQIVGRGTRLFEGKEYFTIIDFVDAYQNFLDPEWDGDPVAATSTNEEKLPKESNSVPGSSGVGVPKEPEQKLKIKLADGKDRDIQHMIQTSFWGADGRPISTQEFLQNMFGVFPQFFKDENELRSIWSSPITRKKFLDSMSELGYGLEQLESVQKIINAENSDMLDVLSYIAYALPTISRINRVRKTRNNILVNMDTEQVNFIDFVLSKYEERGTQELAEEKLSQLLELKYGSISDGEKSLGGVNNIRSIFFNTQKTLYSI